jgi:hypothetical protein
VGRDFKTKGKKAMKFAVETRSVTREAASTSAARLWTGRVLSWLVAAFLLLDATMKLAKPAPVAEAFVRTGWPLALSIPLGVILLTSTVLYLIPRTAVLGAILLTGYLGGAVAANLRLEEPLFTHTLFPVYFGLVIWVSLWLRDQRIRELVPLRNSMERVL